MAVLTRVSICDYTHKNYYPVFFVETENVTSEIKKELLLI